jgi:hypothetical protein
MAAYEVPLTNPLGNQAWIDTAATNTVVQVTIGGSAAATISAADALFAVDIDNSSNDEAVWLKIFLKATAPSLDSDPTGNGAHHFIFKCTAGNRIQYTCPQGWELDVEGAGSLKLWYAVTNVSTPGNDGTALTSTCTVRLLLDVG